MSIPGAGNPLLLGGAAGGYKIERSLRFNSADSAYLSRTPAAAGNRRTFTWSGWIKRSKLGLDGCRLFVAGSGANIFLVRMLTTDVLEIDFYNGTDYGFDTVAVFRDVSAWYHILVSVDTTQATAADRFKVYVNGAQITTLTSFGNVPQNTDLPVNNTVAHAIGNGGGNYYDGYLADIHFIDGQALTPSSFGEFDDNGVWQPKAYSGSYGTNGFKLAFADNSAATATTLGKDTSGNGNNWTPNNLSVTAGAGNDSLVDTPTSYGTDTGAGGEVRGNYATLNPLSNSTGRYTLSDGNLKIAATDAFNAYVSGTIALPASGKFYFEYTCTNTSTSQLRDAVGFVQNNLAQTYLGNSGTLAYEGYVGTVVGVATGNYSTWGNNDVIGIAVDCSTGKVWFSKNNTWQNSGSPTGGTGQVATLTNITNWIPACGAYAGSQFNYTVNGYINFGQRPFAYTAPSGFKALCTTNLPEPTIADPSTAMDVVTYTGNGSTQTISGLGFSPDLVWIKRRTGTVNHVLTDTVRGAALKLASNVTDAEAGTDNGYLSAFTTDGFTVAQGGGLYPGLETNGNLAPYAAWTWDAGSSTVTNTQGSITSQVRANASAGFSIVTYTGTGSAATVGHGLGVAPALIIVKNRDRVTNWFVYHANMAVSPATGYLSLNQTIAFDTASTVWNDTAPTSSVFSVGTSVSTNASSEKIVAYCFAPVAGYSSFGSYTANNSADGPFIYTGFRPTFILFKASSRTSDWSILDAARNRYNVSDATLSPNLSNAEVTGTSTSYAYADFLSNGFKIRGNSSAINDLTNTYIYAAFAENPFQYARAR